MKKILTLSLITLLIVGCVSGPSVELDNNFDGWTIVESGIEFDEITGSYLSVSGKIPTVSSRLFGSRKLAYRYQSDTHTIFIKTEGEAVVNAKNCGWAQCHREVLNSSYYPYLCSKIFGTSLKIKNNYTYRTDNSLGAEFKFYPQVTSATCYSVEEKKQLVAEAESAEKELKDKAQAQALEKKKNTCREYGFKDDTDGMGLCLIQLDKLAAMEQQIIDMQANNQAQANILRQQQADAKRQREAQALMNLGAMIGGYGTSSNSSTSKIDSTTTLPPLTQYSFTRNVQYNQNCPILSGTYKVKEETIGRNKICYYK